MTNEQLLIYLKSLKSTSAEYMNALTEHLRKEGVDITHLGPYLFGFENTVLDKHIEILTGSLKKYCPHCQKKLDDIKSTIHSQNKENGS